MVSSGDFPLPADVNRTPCGGGVPEDRTHTAPSGTRFSCRRSLLSLTVVILSGGPSGSSASSSGWAFLHASDTQLPLLKNFTTITTLYRRTFWAIRTQSTSMSGAKSFHRLMVSLWTARSGDDEGHHHNL